MSKGFFGSLFDLNRDGELDARERALDFLAFEEVLEAEERNERSYDSVYLDLAGLDYEDLELMDEDERREVLEDAGLDPDDYDF